MANQQNSYTGSQGTGTNSADFSFTFPSFTTSEVKVEVDNVVKTLTTHYTVENYNATSGGTVRFTTGNIPTGTTPVRIFRQTNVDNPKATFTAGSSLKAGEINDNFKQLRHALQEAIGALATDRKVQRFNIEADAIDGTLIADDVVDSEHFVAGSIDLEHMSPNSVDSDQYVDGSIDLIHMSPNSVDSDQYVDGSIDLIHMSPNSVDSDQYVDGSIDLVHMSPNSVDSDQYVDGSIDLIHMSANSVDSDQYVDGSIDSAHIANDQIDSQHYAAGSIDLEHMSADSVDSDQYVNGSIDGVHIANDQIDSQHYVAGSIDLEHMAANSVDSDQYVDGSIDHIHLSNDCVDEDNIQNDAVRSEHIQANAVTDSEIATGTLDNRYYTEDELNGGQLNSLYFTESEITGGAADGRYYTETELDAGQLDNRYFTETELTGGALDSRYYTETEAEAKFLRQDSSETIASGVSWSNSDAYVATTAAINARIIDLIDEVGGFTAIANETSFPTTNPQGATGQSAILSVQAASTTLTPQSGTTLTIANGAGSGNTVTITGAPTIPSGFGFLVESTSTTHTYSFHRLVPIATQVNTVASNITNIVNAGANVADINNFADLYQIASSAPTQRADGTSLQDGDLWFDNSNDNLRVYDGSNWAIITPAQSVLDDIAIVSGSITYSEDLGLITDAASTGSSNGSLDIVADALEDEKTFTVTASGGAYLIDGVSKPALTLHKGWTYTFDLSSNTLGSHPLRFSSGGSAYNTGVTVTGTQGTSGAKVQLVVPESQPTTFAYYCTNHSGMGNTITVVEDPIKAVADIASSVVTVGGIASNVTAVANNTSNINAVQANATNINAVQANASNINAAVSNATNINAVVSNATNINTVAGNNSNVTAVANNSSNINSAVSNASNINAAVSNATNINTVSGSISDVNRYANEYKISNSAPGSPSAGDLWFDTANTTLKNYNGSAWLGITSNSGIQNLVDDLTPELYSHLDCNNKNLTEVGTVSGDNLQIDFGTLS